MSEPQYQEYLATGLKIARKANKMIRENFRKEQNIEWKKGDTGFSPVTDIDIAINKLVIAEVSRLYPEHGVIGEEERHGTMNEEYLWICDPIDGTRPFMHGLPLSSFSLAVVRDGLPVVAIVGDPYPDDYYTAVIGEGAYLNKNKISVNDAETLDRQMVHYDCDPMAMSPEIIKDLKIEKSVGTKFCGFIAGGKMVATGSYAGAIYGGKNSGHPHDVAAIKLLVEEAGGKCTDVDGNDQKYNVDPLNGFICSNGHCHDKLVELVQKNLTPQE